MPSPTARRPLLLPAALLCALGACALADRPHQARTRAPVELPGDGAVPLEGGTRSVPRESNPAVAQGEPVDLGNSQCPGVRVLRVDRRFTAAPAGAPPLPPRFFGRDEQGRILAFHDVLACELRMMHWVAMPYPEGNNLVLWRGPAVFEPDDDCDWRDPVRTEAIPHGRRIYAQEHCRHRAHGGPTDRTVAVDVSEDYAHLTLR